MRNPISILTRIGNNIECFKCDKPRCRTRYTPGRYRTEFHHGSKFHIDCPKVNRLDDKLEALVKKNRKKH